MCPELEAKAGSSLGPWSHAGAAPCAPRRLPCGASFQPLEGGAQGHWGLAQPLPCLSGLGLGCVGASCVPGKGRHGG